MQDLNDLFYFAKVVEAGGFAAAGRELGLPKSRLSRRIAELEARLNARLLQRTTRKLALTDIGERYYRHCQAMLVEAEMADEVVAQLSAEPRGRVRLSCPVAMAETSLNAMLPGFLASYPQVNLELLLTNRRVDLVNEGVDVALRVRAPGDEDPSLVTRRLRPAAAVLVATPELLRGRRLQGPDDLAGLPVLGAIGNDRKVHLQLHGPGGEVRELALEARLAAEDFNLRKNVALAGLGITTLPLYYCLEELASGQLVRVLPDWQEPAAFLQAVYPHRRGLLPAVRALIDYLAEGFGRSDEPL
ncbi:DNA-binding transcriptional regulator, LysR family [Pseudomonas citronellolis]|uniref:DNA-binding transcriptional regulator, LysR family n=1 Tax=Pseudomonas citronellolis TaxID=53408 RepID=A0AAQ1KG61_9PSED|nr:LysR substrate-binding domain-containing protein [Pseudomonas citronellolis]MCP1604996.1 DNA-binding transcriptional LysR family regulator [Pseudomonas citronellolis]MCP1644442.1 DNA-binding transcriptional LysR family regulator [Pseudomonas citronellolis]MCP1655765.1 DNA-binding transcriptional LysR family regulator [Pseudomonas citronellolis]MCP1667431.1 DNA-binding transcriptional LysR family regulator [Pseudomonas citronellolis]MCP1698508.1 DNA-binding transcriptional LysR family regula